MRHHKKGKKRSGRTGDNSTSGSSLGSSASLSGGTCTTNPQALQPSSSPSAADWVLVELERAQKQKLQLIQPWKDQLSGADQEDDPNFAQGSDLVLFYDGRVKVCYGETSLAA